MKTKICNTCKESKSIGEFFKDRQNPDGLCYRCKKCDVKKSVKYQRESGFNRTGKRADRNNHKRRAKSAVNTAVRSGRLPRVHTLNCIDCGVGARHYHHESYDREKWLDVVPLCTACHNNRHHPSPTGSAAKLLTPGN